MKHLNPRQGITTDIRAVRAPNLRYKRGCETPKSPPGDYNQARALSSLFSFFSVKHLNPRQGITTCAERHRRCARRRLVAGVKHLNPRQGITTQIGVRARIPTSMSMV